MESELKKKLERISSFINVNSLIKGDKNKIRDIRKYYRINKFAYKKFHSDHGFMHFRISQNGEYLSSDVYYQPDTILKFISQNCKVVELGPGQGANIFYMCQKRNDASFIGVDLKPPKKPRRLKNLKLVQGDYSNLDFLEDNSIDLVFGIETIVHCSNKDKVFKEVNRILKPNGIFIVYDYALVKEFDEYQEYEKTAIELISKCGASALIESDSTWDKYFLNNNFEKISKKDFGQKIIPDLHRLSIISEKIMNHDKRIKISFGLLPTTLTNNILIGYIGEEVYKEGIGLYNEWIYKKGCE